MIPQQAIDILANFISHPSTGDDKEADAIEAMGVLQMAVSNGGLTFYAYEVATDGAFELGAYLKEADRDVALDFVLKRLEYSGEDVETRAVGTTKAMSWKAAIDCVRAGRWEYSQLV